MKDIKKGIFEIYDGLSPGSKSLYAEALTLFPGGVTHDYRYFQPYPVYIARAKGSKKWDVDGNEYIDFWSGHGALLLGHAPDEVVEAVCEQVALGTHLGGCHSKEVEWARLVTEMIPSAKKVRFTSSGTEATIMCIRLARIFTGKSKVIKFAGHFHGWHDQLFHAVNPPYEVPSPGIPDDVGKTTIVLPPNDRDAIERTLSSDDDIACIIIEPTGASFGSIPTGGDFLRYLRDVTNRYGVLLIFDEVITGFRVSPGGAQEYYGVLPDLTALAKVLAGGFPGGAVAGRSDIMELLEIRDDREWMLKKKMPHLGTFNANPVSAAAGIATLKVVRSGEPCRIANARGAMLRKGMNEIIDRYGLNWCVYGEFSGFRFLFDRGTCTSASEFNPYECDYLKLKGKDNRELARILRRGMLINGVDIPEAGGWIMAAHTEEDVERTLQAFEKSIILMKREELV
ncbi:MAG: aspartate aminotransferase family protein [Spirochaetota bacterium]